MVGRGVLLNVLGLSIFTLPVVQHILLVYYVLMVCNNILIPEEKLDFHYRLL